MAKLTPKQELFVQGIISGLSQRQAYRQAFPNSRKWKDSAVDSNASGLLQNTKVLQRYRELLKQFSNMALWSREQAFNEYEWLKNKARASIDEEGVRQANSNAFLSALDGMNRMAGVGDELLNDKLQAEIDVLKAKTQVDNKTEDKMQEYFTALNEVL